MRAQGNRKILFGLVMVGIISILIVVLSAYSAELKMENNKLADANDALQSEIDTLNVKIKSANNVEHIEHVATTKLGMVYPTKDECIYVSDAAAPKENFAMVIREKVYN